MNLIDIARGWYNFTAGSSYVKVLMEKRLAICDKCPHKKQLSPAGKLLVQAINEDGNLFKCGICHCPLAALTSLPGSKCRDGRWGPAGEESYF